jgi:hypothetical protein
MGAFSFTFESAQITASVSAFVKIAVVQTVLECSRVAVMDIWIVWAFFNI